MATIEMLGNQGDVEIIACTVSAQVLAKVVAGEVDGAVLPIENSLHGSVAEHYDLLLELPVRIERESLLRIRHNVIAMPGVTLAEVRKVMSHPVALSQCRRFLAAHPEIQVVPFYDTAGSVKHVIANQMKDAAGIAGRQAAREYAGKILQASIEDDKRNFTRFFLIRKVGKHSALTSAKTHFSQRRREAGHPLLHPLLNAAAHRVIPAGANKTSIAFKVRNVPGALFKSLSVFALRDISLSKIESRPMRGRPWEYVFYVDFLRGDDEAARNALRHLGEVAEFIKVLGIYPAA